VSSEKKPLTNSHRTNNPENLEDSTGVLELFNQLNEEQKKEAITRLQKYPHIHSISQFWGGPIPPPLALKEYEDVLPGTADRIIKMAEKQSIHRQRMEKEALDKAYRFQSRGQHYALIVVSLLAVGGMLLIGFGHEISGVILSGTTLVGLAYAFISTGEKQKKPKDDSFNDGPE